MTKPISVRSIPILLVETSRLWQQALQRATAISGLALTPGQIRTLVCVAHHAGWRQSEIAEEMNVEPMTLTSFLDVLEEKGLIVRGGHPSDRRAKVVTLTREAELLLRVLEPFDAQVCTAAMAGLGISQLETFGTMLAAVRANLVVMGRGCSSGEVGHTTPGSQPSDHLSPRARVGSASVVRTAPAT